MTLERSTFQHFVHVVDGSSKTQISRERESLQDWEGQVEGVQHLCHHDLVLPGVQNLMLQEQIEIDQSFVHRVGSCKKIRKRKAMGREGSSNM